MIGDETYAIMTGNMDDGFQVIGLSDPTNPTPVASATDGATGFDELYGARKVRAFLFGGTMYAIVASSPSASKTVNSDDGIQVIDLSDPSNPTAVASATDGDPGFDTLVGAHGVETFVVGGKTYAIITCNGNKNSAGRGIGTDKPGSIQVIELV